MRMSDFSRFNELAESVGNKYLAIQLISEWARELGREYKDYYIVESKLLQWVITGRCPYVESELESRKFVTDYDKVEDFLSWVMDTEVSSEVKRLYKKSVRNQHLQRCDNKQLSESRKNRVDILLRMIWYSSSIKGGN